MLSQLTQNLLSQWKLQAKNCFTQAEVEILGHRRKTGQSCFFFGSGSKQSNFISGFKETRTTCSTKWRTRQNYVQPRTVRSAAKKSYLALGMHDNHTVVEGRKRQHGNTAEFDTSLRFHCFLVDEQQSFAWDDHEDLDQLRRTATTRVKLPNKARPVHKLATNALSWTGVLPRNKFAVVLWT